MPDIQIKQQPISVWQEGGEWKSTGIAWEDFSRMNTQQRKQSGARRLPTPSWAVNDSEFRELLVNFLEERALIKPWQRTGTIEERLKRAQETIMARCKQVQRVMDNLCAQYVTMKRTAIRPEDRARLRKLEQMIENYDTRLRFESKDGGAAMVTAVRYLYYRVCLDSCGVGTELGIKPPHVRQILWRLHQTAKTLERWRQDLSTRPTGSSQLIDVARATALYESGKTLAEVAAAFGTSSSDAIRRVLVQAGVKLRGRRIDVCEAVRLHNVEKKSCEEIAALFGNKPDSVYHVLREVGFIGCKKRRKARTARRLRKEPFNAARAVELFQSGMNVPQIVQVFGYPPRHGQNRTRAALIKAGVYPRKPATA